MMVADDLHPLFLYPAVGPVSIGEISPAGQQLVDAKVIDSGKAWHLKIIEVKMLNNAIGPIASDLTTV